VLRRSQQGKVHNELIALSQSVFSRHLRRVTRVELIGNFLSLLSSLQAKVQGASGAAE